MVVCLERGADDLHMVQLMLLPPHHLLLQLKSRMVYPSGTGLPRLSWKKRPLNVCVLNGLVKQGPTNLLPHFPAVFAELIEGNLDYLLSAPCNKLTNIAKQQKVKEKGSKGQALAPHLYQARPAHCKSGAEMD